LDGDVKVYASVETNEPVSVRIPWLKLKSGGMDRSSLVLWRANSLAAQQSVDYPAKTNTQQHRLTQQQQQAQALQQTLTHAHKGVLVARQAELQLFRTRAAYNGLRMDTIEPFMHGVQQRPLSNVSLVLPLKPGESLPSSSAAPTPSSSSSSNVVGLFQPRSSSARDPLRGRLVGPEDSAFRESKFWAPEEDNLLQACIAEYGTNFQLAALVLAANPRFGTRARSQREVQNRFNYLMHQKAGGVDPIKPGAPGAPDAAGAVPPPVDDGLKKKSSRKDSKHAAAAAAAAAAASASGAQKKSLKSAGGGGFGVGFGSKQVVNYVERAHKTAKMDQLNVRTQLRTHFGLPLLDDANKLQQMVLQPPHKSHKETIFEAHMRLGLPEPAMGKTLMPHQILQLRSRRMHDRPRGGGGQQLTAEQHAHLQAQRMQQRQQMQQQQGGHPGMPPGAPPPQRGYPNGSIAAAGAPPMGPGGGPQGMSVGPPPQTQRVSSTPVGGRGPPPGGVPPGPHYPQQQSSSRGPNQGGYSQGTGGQGYPPQQGGGSGGGGNYVQSNYSQAQAQQSMHPSQAAPQSQNQQPGYGNPSQLTRYQTVPSSSSGSSQQQQSRNSMPYAGGQPGSTAGGGGGYNNQSGSGQQPPQMQQQRMAANGPQGSGYYPPAGGAQSYSNSGPSPPPGAGGAPQQQLRAKSPAGGPGPQYNYPPGGAAGGSSQQQFYPNSSSGGGGGGGGGYYPPPSGAGSSTRGGGYVAPGYSSGGGGGGNFDPEEAKLQNLLTSVSTQLPAAYAAALDQAQRKQLSVQQRIDAVQRIIKQHTDAGAGGR
jgi:hypothetical protein